MASATYRLFAKAMKERKQIVCIYDGRPRELCPVILGHSDGQEKALTYQFGGSTSPGRRLPQWRCIELADVADVQLRDGPWHSGDRHSQAQSCVKVVDLDVNPASPYKPKRRT
jgi:hypothetical protein